MTHTAQKMKFSIKDFFSKCDRIHRKQRILTTWNVSKYGVFSGPYFPLFWMNSEIYSLNFRIHSEYRKSVTFAEEMLHGKFHSLWSESLIDNCARVSGSNPFLHRFLIRNLLRFAHFWSKLLLQYGDNRASI